jgi:hypothetical protein
MGPYARPITFPFLAVQPAPGLTNGVRAPPVNKPPYGSILVYTLAGTVAARDLWRIDLGLHSTLTSTGNVIWRQRAALAVLSNRWTPAYLFSPLLEGSMS